MHWSDLPRVAAYQRAPAIEGAFGITQPGFRTDTGHSTRPGSLSERNPRRGRRCQIMFRLRLGESNTPGFMMALFWELTSLRACMQKGEGALCNLLWTSNWMWFLGSRYLRHGGGDDHLNNVRFRVGRWWTRRTSNYCVGVSHWWFHYERCEEATLPVFQTFETDVFILIYRFAKDNYSSRVLFKGVFTIRFKTSYAGNINLSPIPTDSFYNKMCNKLTSPQTIYPSCSNIHISVLLIKNCATT